MTKPRITRATPRISKALYLALGFGGDGGGARVDVDKVVATETLETVDVTIVLFERSVEVTVLVATVVEVMATTVVVVVVALVTLEVELVDVVAIEVWEDVVVA